jgi:hypothetical protein
MKYNIGEWVSWCEPGSEVRYHGFILATGKELIGTYAFTESGMQLGYELVDVTCEDVKLMSSRLCIEDLDILIDIALVIGDKEWFNDLSLLSEASKLLPRILGGMKGVY